MWEPLDNQPGVWISRDASGAVASLRIDDPTTQRIRGVRLRPLPIRRTRRAFTLPTDLPPIGRVPGESPDDFYARIRIVHALLSELTDAPTSALADWAGVPIGTAAAWMHRARKRAN